MIYRTNSTIEIKKKNCTSCGKLSVIFSKGRCASCSKIEDTHKKIASSQMDEAGLPELIEKLDELVSKWVRYSAINEDGLVECYTCKKKYPPADLDAGHYVSRKCAYLRFDVARNIRPQCWICNRGKHGEAAAFGKRLEIDAPGATEILLEESKIIYKWSRDELRSLIDEFYIKIKSLKV